MRTDELLKDGTEVVNVGRVDVEGSGMRDIIEVSIGEEKKGRKGGVDVLGSGFGGGWVLLGADRRPWIVGDGGCGEITGVAVCGGEVEVPCWGGE